MEGRSGRAASAKTQVKGDVGSDLEAAAEEMRSEFIWR